MQDGMIWFGQGQGAGHPALALIRGYWLALRPGPDAIPARVSVQAEGMEAALPHALIVERTGSGAARLRVAGQAVARLLGSDARGADPGRLFDPAARVAFGDVLEQVLAGPAIAELGLSAPGFGPVGRLLLLPLADAGGRVTMALGGIAVDDGVEGRRFTIASTRLVRLRAEQVAPPLPGFAEAGVPLRGRPGLRLVHSSK